MSKKRLFLLPALLLALTSCGPTTPTSGTTDPVPPTTSETDPTTPAPSNPTVEVVATSVTITNKDALLQPWVVNKGEGDRREVKYEVTFSDGTTKTTGATVTSSDSSIINAMGKYIFPVGEGTATVTVTVGDLTDSLEITVTGNLKEATVSSIKELLTKPVNNATAYTATGVIVKWDGTNTDAGNYGNWWWADTVDAPEEEWILVYGCTEVQESLVYDETTELWSWVNPNSSKYEGTQTPFPKDKYGIGDTVTIKGLRLDYGEKKEFNGIVLDHQAKPLDPVSSAEVTKKATTIGTHGSYTYVVTDNNGKTDLFNWEIVTGADIITLNKGTVKAADKTGAFKIKATSTANAEVFVEIEGSVVERPAIIEGASLADIIADESGKGAKLWKVQVKTVANDSTSDGDKYGNFDYVDPTNSTVKITSYGLSKGSSVINYYDDAFRFTNAKNFADTGVTVGSDEVYTVVVMRSDYKETKQLVGYIYEEEVPADPVGTVYENLSVADALAKKDGFGGEVKNTSNYLYEVTGIWEPTGKDDDVYGNGYLVDEKDSSVKIQVYGLSKAETALVQNEDKTWTFTNAKDFQDVKALGLEAGEKLTIKAIGYTYKSNPQLMGVYVSHEDVAHTEIVKLYAEVDKAWWTADNAACGLYYWGDTTTAAPSWPGHRMSLVEGETTIWEIELTKDELTAIQGLIVVRVAPVDQEISDFGAKTPDITGDDLAALKDGTSNLITITSETEVWGNPGVEYTLGTYSAEGGETVDTSVLAASLAFTAENKTADTTVYQFAANGVTVTGSIGDNDPSTYSAPARFYQSTSLKFEYTSDFVKLVVHCNSSKKIDGLVNAIDATLATVTSDGYDVTIVLVTPAKSFEIASVAAQFRADSVDVYTTAA